MHFRTYSKELVTNNDMSNVSKDLVVAHLAVFERSIELSGGRTYKKDYVASCITFTPQGRVPAGLNYRVKVDYCLK